MKKLVARTGHRITAVVGHSAWWEEVAASQGQSQRVNSSQRINLNAAGD
jgi:hypothetical protein